MLGSAEFESIKDNFSFSLERQRTSFCFLYFVVLLSLLVDMLDGMVSCKELSLLTNAAASIGPLD